MKTDARKDMFSPQYEGAVGAMTTPTCERCCPYRNPDCPKCHISCQFQQEKCTKMDKIASGDPWQVLYDKCVCRLCQPQQEYHHPDYCKTCKADIGITGVCAVHGQNQPQQAPMNQDKKVERTRTITVRCTFDLPVEIPDDPNYDEVFDIEENHCPGTGLVGAALDKRIREQNEKGLCWACGLNAKNEII